LTGVKGDLATLRNLRAKRSVGHCQVARGLSDKMSRCKKSKSLYHGHRFPAGVISCAVRWYFRFQLSLRDIEELLFERGVMVGSVAIRPS
jgi:hypothetical protein